MSPVERVVGRVKRILNPEARIGSATGAEVGGAIQGERIPQESGIRVTGTMEPPRIRYKSGGVVKGYKKGGSVKKPRKPRY